MKTHLIILAILTMFGCEKWNQSTAKPENPPKIQVIHDTIYKEIIRVPPQKSIQETKAILKAKGYKTFDYINPKTHDTILMQQYFIAILKAGALRGQNEEEENALQKGHLEHLEKMYALGYADISGPFANGGALRGITIYNVPTLHLADSLAKSDPMVKAGRLEVDVYPWWAGKGFELR